MNYIEKDMMKCLEVAVMVGVGLAVVAAVAGGILFLAALAVGPL